MAVLAASGIAKRFADGDASRWVLRDIHFAVETGRTVALWGPSGSGKSTLLNILAGITLPDAGVVRFDLDADRMEQTPDCCSAASPTLPARDREAVASFVVSDAAERHRVRFRRRHIGFVFQFFNLVPTLTVAENVLLPLELNRLPERRAAALARLDALGVGHCADRFPETLSGGEQQRVAIARALAHAPPVVLADEPTGNLDSANAASVTDALWAGVRDAGCALVVATHNERIAERADDVIDLS